MMILLTLFNVPFTLFCASAVKLIGLFWQLDKNVKKIKNKINFEAKIIHFVATWNQLKMEQLC